MVPRVRAGACCVPAARPAASASTACPPSISEPQGCPLERLFALALARPAASRGTTHITATTLSPHRARNKLSLKRLHPTSRALLCHIAHLVCRTPHAFVARLMHATYIIPQMYNKLPDYQRLADAINLLRPSAAAMAAPS